MKKMIILWLFMPILLQAQLATSPIIQKENVIVANSSQKITEISKPDEQKLNAFLESLRTNPRYGMVEDYKEGLARIKKDQVYGFLNLKGEEIIPPQYEYAETFNNGKALAKKVYWYFVESNGNESEILEDVIDAKAIKNGISQVKFKSGKIAFIDNHFDTSKKTISALYDEITPIGNDLFSVRNGQFFGLMRPDASMKVEAIYEKISFLENKEWILVEQSHKIGLINANGEIQIKPTFDNITQKNNYFIAQNVNEVRLFDLKNHLVSEPYRQISDFDDKGIAIVQDSKKLFGLINLQLDVIALPFFAAINSFNALNLALASKTNEKGEEMIGFINRQGIVQIPIVFEKASKFNRFGLIVMSKKIENCKDKNIENCLTDIIYDYKGRIILENSEKEPLARYALTDTSFFSRYLVIKTLKQNGLNLIDRRHAKRLTPITVSGIRRIGDGFFAISKDDKWGLIDTTGKIIFNFEYNDIINALEDLFGVKYKTDKWGFVNNKGKVVVSYEFEMIEPFQNGLAVVSKGDNRIGIINHFNAKIVPCAFASIKFDANYYELKDKTGEIFKIDAAGNCSDNCQKFNKILKKANQN